MSTNEDKDATADETLPRAQPAADEPQPAERAHRPRSRNLRHREHGTLVATGPSGTVYRFCGHGATLKVKGEDIDALLALGRNTRSCCGAAAVQRQRFLVAVSS